MGYDEVLRLALERGFYFPSSEAYPDAHAGFWEYGPAGAALKGRFLELWRRELVRGGRMMEIDGAQVMPPSVFRASGHLEGFTDPVARCSKCGLVARADRLAAEASGREVGEREGLAEIDAALAAGGARCPKCGGAFGPAERFNMMFRLGVGPGGEDAYLRPETCQSIFVAFPRLYKTMRGRLPMGVAQVGKSFRNEISPRQGLLRLREFYQAEIEVFYDPGRPGDGARMGEVASETLRLHEGGATREVGCAEAAESGAVPGALVAYHLGLLSRFYRRAGLDPARCRLRRLGARERAFYAEDAFDFEVETSVGWLELVACNCRGAHDLSSHAAGSGGKFEAEGAGGGKVTPHVFEMSMGIDRSLYALLEHGLRRDEANDRTVLSLRPYLAPVQVGVLSLVKKDGLRERADGLFAGICRGADAFLDHSGAIGRRYRRLDEVGAPFAVTVDHRTLEDGTVTLRERDSMAQERVPESELAARLAAGLAYP